MASSSSVARSPRGQAARKSPGLLSGRYDPEETYPEVPIGLGGITIQPAWLTPEMAGEFVTRLGRNQRTTKLHQLRSIVSDITNDLFRFNGEPIIFDPEGNLLNGRHRCLSVVQTGRPVPVLIIRGIPASAYMTMDITSKRTVSDALKSGGFKNTRDLAAAARLLECYERDLFNEGYMIQSAAAGVEFVEENPGLIESCSLPRGVAKLCRHAGAPIFCHYVFAQHAGKEEADLFFERLASDVGHKQGDAILTLRRYLMKDSLRPTDRELVFLIFKTWNAFRRGKDVRKLSYQSGERLPDLV
jgi:hypothetical protein